MTLFLAALWWQKAKPAVDRQLRRLLRKRHRDLNIDFVIELILRDLIPGSDIPKRTVHLLRRELTADNRQDDGRWVATAKRLYLLDPAELEKVIEDPVPTITPHRRLDAVDIFRKHDPERGAEKLRSMAHSLPKTGTPQEWLDTAVLIGKINKVLGAQTMLLLANIPKMGELRVDAAIRAKEPNLLRDMIIEHERNLSDHGRLRLSEELLGLNWSMAVPAMEQFAQTARKDDTPLRIAKMMILPRDQPAVLRIANEVAWPANKKGNSSERLSAVIFIGEIDPAQAIPQLHDLSKDPSVTDAVRFRAAMLIITEHEGPITALVNLGKDPKLGRPYRVEAAEFVGKLEHATGAQIYISIAETCTLTDQSRLTLLEKAYKLDPGPATEALAEVAKNGRIPGPIRCDAVKIARPTLDTRRTISLYTTIARTTKDAPALVAAREVMAMNQDAGKRLLGELADRSNAATRLATRFRLIAAVEADTYGVSALTDIADTAQSYTEQLEALQALCLIDRKKANPRLQKLVKKHGAGKVRIDAALTLSGRLAVDALITIVMDSCAEETIRCDAGIKAKEIHEKRGRQALLDFAKAPGISEETRKKVHRHL